ncbi:MAG: GSCFA domain-containing protein [Lentisphaeria bacterium]|nr:GSCFA domain-containing protein [Lentisphaeria bacterium]
MEKGSFSAEKWGQCFQEVPFSWKYGKWDEKSVFVSMGSCFSEEIVSLLSGAGLSIRENPNGILYNPVSIADSLERIAENRLYTEEDFFFYDGLWRSFSHHGRFSREERCSAVSAANEALKAFQAGLARADGIFLTLSSAVVYRVRETGKVAANCHRLPQETFERSLLSSEKCLESCVRIVESIRKCNGKGVIVFSLSPVRHYPGEPLLNSVSKARLRCAVEDVLDREKVAYFPAYEIVNDSLRDYRFYREDLVHPSPLAVEIVLETFLKECFSPSVREKVRLYRKTCAGKNHIPGNGGKGTLS